MAQKQTTDSRHKDERRRDDSKGEAQGSNTGIVKPQTPHGGFGLARRKDVNDSANQAQAPSAPRQHFDRTGEEQYAEGMESFEEAGGSGFDGNRKRLGAGGRKPHSN